MTLLPAGFCALVRGVFTHRLPPALLGPQAEKRRRDELSLSAISPSPERGLRWQTARDAVLTGAARSAAQPPALALATDALAPLIPSPALLPALPDTCVPVSPS